MEVIGGPERRALARRQGLVAADQPLGQLLADPLQALQPGFVAGRLAAAEAARQMNLVTGMPQRLDEHARHLAVPGGIGMGRRLQGGVERDGRSGARRVGKEVVSTGWSRWLPD